MPLECGTIVGFKSRESNVGKLGPQQRNEVEPRYAPASAKQLAHPALRAVAANRTPYSTRCDDPQPAAFETIREHEQGQVTAADADTLPLDAEELAASANPVVPGQSTFHVPRRRECPAEDGCVRSAHDTERRFRPFPRRRRKISLPAFVLIRFRNPCVRLRRRLFGWYVRFMPSSSRGLLARTGRIPNKYHSSHLLPKSTAERESLCPRSRVDSRLSWLLGCGTFSVPDSQLLPPGRISTGCGRNCGNQGIGVLSPG